MYREIAFQHLSSVHFKVFEKERDVKRKNCRGLLKGPFFTLANCCKCFGEIEHDEPPSTDEEGEDEQEITWEVSCC